MVTMCVSSDARAGGECDTGRIPPTPERAGDAHAAISRRTEICFIFPRAHLENDGRDFGGSRTEKKTPVKKSRFSREIDQSKRASSIAERMGGGLADRRAREPYDRGGDLAEEQRGRETPTSGGIFFFFLPRPSTPPAPSRATDKKKERTNANRGFSSHRPRPSPGRPSRASSSSSSFARRTSIASSPSLPS